MDRRRHQRVAKLFQKALALDHEEREALLARECGDDAAMRAEVEALLKADADDDSRLLDTPPEGLRAQGLKEFARSGIDAADDMIGRRIGRYTLRRVIAFGGMGTVYEAHQESPDRTVALKFMRRGLSSRSGLRRFEDEGQILARLRHPVIAQVFDAGVYEDEVGGQRIPYFVMEYIRGARTITDFARERDLSLKERLHLVTRVCEAVHHGHQKGIIHRDLKPENILVDADGDPKIIDFGIAKATADHDAVTALQTLGARLMGTLQYMSPEQCGAADGDIDTRSDVYSLGVVLHELLAGAPPYNLTNLTVHQAIRVICGDDPAPSRASLDSLPRDLRMIVHTAIQRDREARYGSVAALAGDIVHFLRNEPISARPPGTIYQLRKLVQRNLGLAAALVAAILALCAGTLFSTIFALQATAQRNEASKAQKEAELALEEQRAVAAMMLDIMQTSIGRYETVSKDALLIGAEKYLNQRSDADPRVKAALCEYIGLGFLNRNSAERAEPMLREALELRRAEGEINTALENCLRLNASLHMLKGDPDEARTLLREVLQVRRQLFGPDHMNSVPEGLRDTIWTYLPDEPEGRAEVERLEAGRRSTRKIDERWPPSTESSDLPIIFNEGFDAPALGPEWMLSLDNVKAWDGGPEQSALIVRNIECDQAKDAIVSLTQSFEPIDDFHLTCDLLWEQDSIHDMSTIRIDFIGEDEVLMLLVAYSDGWIDWYGGAGAFLYPTRGLEPPRASTGPHSLPLSGSIAFDVVRRGDRTVILRDGEEFLLGVTTERLAEIRITFIGYPPILSTHDRTPEFGLVGVRSILLRGSDGSR